MSEAVEGQREFGEEAIRRRLGALMKQRREEMGLSRVDFAKQADVGSDATVRHLEFANRWGWGSTLRKMESALGWKYGVLDQILLDVNRKASSITMEELDAPAEEPTLRPLWSFSTQELLREVASRLDAIQAGAALGQPGYDLAASENREHLEGDGKDA